MADLVELLSAMKDDEQKGMYEYEKIIALVSDPKDKKILMSNQKDEFKHLKRVAKLLKKYSK